MTTARTHVNLYKSIERYGHLRGDRLDTEATAADIMRDFIVIPRSDLPSIAGPDSEGYYMITGGCFEDEWVGTTATPGEIRRTALELLAIAEHLEAHPPIDEAQVDALREVLRSEWFPDDDQDSRADTLARRLVAAGVRAPQVGDDQ